MKNLSIDDVFSVIGEFGCSQKIYYFGLNLLQIFTAFHMLLNVYTGLEPSFKCYPKSETRRIEPLEDKCFDNEPLNCQLLYTSEYKSFATEWDLVCNRKYKVALVQSVWMGGVMTGALLLGGTADAIGRLKTLMVALLSTIAFEGFSAFAPTFMIMVGLRFIGGVGCALIILSSFVLSQELVGTNYRSTCGMFMAIFFSVGICIFSALASVLSDWRTLSLICSLSGIFFLVLPCYVPESPRWLVVKGKKLEAKAILVRMAKKNGKLSDLPSHWELSTNRVEGQTKSNRSQGVRDLVSHPYVLMLTLIQVYSWFVNSATYYGLTIAASDLGGNVYVSTALSGLIEIPACIIGVAIIDRIGRRLTLCGFMLIGGIACLCIQVVPPSLVTVTTSLALCGKLSIAASFSVIYVHSAEIFPTAIRNSGMGIVSVAARFGGILAPVILMLGEYLPNLQFTAFGGMTLLAGVLNLKLPETMGKPMPESVADILALRHTKGPGKEYEYNKLQFDEEEVDVTEEEVRSRSPSNRIRIKAEDQVPLVED